MNKKRTNKPAKMADPITTKSGRAVYVPKGATAYVVAAGQPLPAELGKIAEGMAQAKYEDMVHQFKEAQNRQAMQTVNQRPPTVEEMASDIMRTLTDHSYGEQNKVLAVVLHRMKRARKKEMEAAEHVKKQHLEILLEMQDADNELDAITLGNFTVIE